MKIKVSEASGLALDWMVATCEGYTNLRVGAFAGGGLFMDPPRVAYGAVDFSDLNYSCDWARGGPIIEREVMFITPHGTTHEPWQAALSGRLGPGVFDGATPLIAAMRCYVASKLGDEVDVPDQLINKE